MATRVFIPIPRSPLVDLQTGEIAPEWYLFLSRTIGGSTLTDTEILAAYDSDYGPQAVAAQNTANDAKLLAQSASTDNPESSKRVDEARIAADLNQQDRAEIAELRKEVDNLRAMIEMLVQSPLPQSDARIAARITMRI